MRGAGVHWASPEYFSTVGIQLRKGRLFTADDRAERPKVVIVNETAAKAFWPNADPIGKTITMGMGGFESGAEVVGVVSDVRYSTIRKEAHPFLTRTFRFSKLHRHVCGSSSAVASIRQALVPVMRQEIMQLDSSLPLSGSQDDG